MNAIELLTKDHRKVEELFAELEQAEGGAARSEIFQRICEEVLVHAHAEEQVLYPAAREQLEDADELVQDSLEEHHAVEERLTKLLEMDPDDASFLQRCLEVRDLIDHHVEEEENQLFPQMRAQLEEQELDAMGEELQQVKEEELAEGPVEQVQGSTRRGGARSSREAGEPTKQELYEEAKRQEIQGRSKMSKEELKRELGR